MALIKFELVFAMVMRLDRELSSVIYYCGLTVRMAWSLVWLDRLVVTWPFTEKKTSPREMSHSHSGKYICDALRDLIPFVQLCRSVTFSLQLY